MQLISKNNKYKKVKRFQGGDPSKIRKLRRLERKSKEYRDTYKDIAGKGTIVTQDDNNKALYAGELDEVTVRPSNYDKGKRFGREVINSTNETGKKFAPFVIGGMALPFAPVAQTVLNNPLVQGALTIDGAYNLFTGNGVPKTFNHIKNGEYKDAALSGLGDALDLTGGLGLLNKYRKFYAGAESVQDMTKHSVKPRIRSKTITEAERAGIPKGERKSPSPYKQIGTVTEPKSQKETLTVDSPIFGDFIDNGSQQTVFQNATDPSKVLKVYTERKFTSTPEIKEFHKQWMKRNRLPLQERINLEGYLQGNGRIYPVYSQNKVDILGNILPKEWTTIHLPKLNEEMHKLGYKGSGTYTNGKLTVGDISPFNVGYVNGNLRLIDADIYRKGGRLLYK